MCPAQTSINRHFNAVGVTAYLSGSLETLRIQRASEVSTKRLQCLKNHTDICNRLHICLGTFFLNFMENIP